MQISIKNGTLINLSETLIADSGYTLPSSISVTGADFDYDSTSGSLTLSNITKSISITASGGEQPTPPGPTPTGTTWIFNADGITPRQENGTTTWFINFISNGTNFTSMVLSEDWWDDFAMLYYDQTQAGGNSSYGGWVNESFRKVTITGGSDITNASLIAWLEANATQVPVADLTGTTWLFNESVNVTQNVSYNINCSYDNGTYSSIDFQYFTEDGKTWKGISLDQHTVDIAYLTAQANPISVEYPLMPITITGGTDSTNNDLIVWLETNANCITAYEEGTTPNVTLINFTITMYGVGAEYQTEEGMTWTEWCSSEYNQADWMVGDGIVYTPSAQKYIKNQSPSDVITDNSNYTTGNYGG